MWLMLKGLALRFVVGRTVGGTLATLFAVLLPIGGILKFIGLPLLLVLGVLGAPLFLLLAVIGLPVLFVLGIGGAILLFLGVLLTVGLIAIKILLPIILIVWLVRWIFARNKPRPGTVEGPAAP
jgi:hypothetical protein